MTDKPIIEMGQKFPLTIKKLGINGEGVGFFKRNVVFVPGALPGEEVTAQVTIVKHNFAQARILKIRKASPHRQTPPCPIFETCGGCQLQHLSYSQQLVEKRDLVLQSLDRYLRGTDIQVRETIGMDDPWHYRNKSQFQTRKKDGKVMAGLFAEGSQQLLDIEQCLVQHPDTVKITNAAKRIIEELNLSIYDGKSMKGLIRTIAVRTAVKTGEIQLVLITTRKDIPKKKVLVERLSAIDPNLVSIVQNVNAEKTSLVFGETTHTLFGKPTIHEELGELSFDLSALSLIHI